MQFSEKYALYRGHGKLAVLFIAAIICLIFIKKEHRGRIHPLLFVVSIYTGIATALANMLRAAFGAGDNSIKSNKKQGVIYGIIAVMFALFAITLCGTRIWSCEFIKTKEEIKTAETDLDAVASYLAGLDDNPKILTDYQIMNELLARSSKLQPMYKLENSAKISDMSIDERKLFEAINDQHPKMEQITRLARSNGHYYVVVDKTSSWPERAVEGMYSLINTIDIYDIYEYGGAAYE